jgi:hypothetical protein
MNFFRATLERVNIAARTNDLKREKVLDTKFLIDQLGMSQVDADVTVDWRYQFEDVEFKTMY